jgi:hypothetical protein
VISRTTTIFAAAALIIVLAATASACGTNDDGPGSTASSGSTTTTVGPGVNVVLTVEQALAAEPGQTINVRGFIVSTSEETVLCSALAESYPPQAAGPSVKVEGLDLDALVGLSTTAGQEGLAKVTWSDYWVTLTGVVTDGVLEVQATPRVIETSVGDLKIRFSPVSEPITSGDLVWWAFDVINTGKTPVDLTFSSGQRGDVALIQDDVEKYRWSDGKAFTEAIEMVTLQPGKYLPVVLNDTLALVPGDYDVVAVVTASVGGPGEATALPEILTTLTVH